MKFLFDTDHISFLQDPWCSEYGTISARVSQHSSADFAFNIVSFHEQTRGAHNYINRAKKSSDVVRGYELFGAVLRAFQAAPVLLFDGASAAVFDFLRKQQVRIGTLDMRIAAIALSQNLVLLTRNSKDFCRVPGLVTEDWTV